MGLASFSGHCWKGIDDRVGFWLIGRDRTRGVSARSVLMADVKDANATPDTVSVSLHDRNRFLLKSFRLVAPLERYGTFKNEGC